MYSVLIKIQYLCLISLFIEGWLVIRKCESKLHAYLLFSIIANIVNSAGYLFELKAETSEAYMTALKLSYFGRVWVAFSIALFVTELCRKKVPNAVKIALALLNIAIFITVLTTPAHDLFYKDIDFIRVDGFIRMMRSSGIVHKIQSIMVAFYMIYILVILLMTRHKEHNKRTKTCLTTVFISMITQAVFTTVQIFVPTPITYIYDLTMPGFAIGTVIMLIAIRRYDLLETSELARKFMIDRLSECIIAADEEGIVTFYNQPALYLYPHIELPSSHVPSNITDAIANGTTITINDRIYSAEKKELTQRGKHIGTLYALVDETEHYKYMQALEQQKQLADSANQAKSSFLANMSHDIRTPINAVLGMNEMVLRECDDEQILDYSEKIKSAGNTLLGLINDILDFSKIEAGKLDIIPVDYDLTSVLNDLVNMIQPRADAKGLALVTKIDGNIPKLLHGDEIRIKQIITNILTNAVKYTEKGTVTFSVGYEKKDENSIVLKVSVADTGIGIKQEDIPKLFSDFERIDEKRIRNVEGTGLGMSITQRLLSMMDSSLGVESEYGKGSVFSFALTQEVIKWEPVGNLDDALRRSHADRKKYREKFTAPDADILVVDDTPMNLEVFTNLLKKTLVRIDTAESGEKCISLAFEKKYDIIFLDHMMPGKDGIETLSEMRTMKDIPNADTPVVCLTANAVSGSREKYLAAGFNDYLTKPVDPTRLEQMIMEYLPDEKIVRMSAQPEAPGNTEETGSDSEKTRLPDWLNEIAEIDTGKGLLHCGTAETYLSTLTTYAGSVAASADEIEGFLKNGDIKNATVKIHAIKSTSRVIGAMDLGSLAEELEAAGNTNDTDKLNAHTDELLSRCRKLGEQLSPLLKTDDLPPISEDELNEAFTLIREFLSVEDFESAVQVIGGLSEYSYPENEKQRCESLRKAAAEFDYDAMRKIMEQGE